MEKLLLVRFVGRSAILPLRQLGLGWRLARSDGQELEPRPWRGGLRRLRRRARDGRRDRAGWSDRRWTAYRQIRSGWQAECYAGTHPAAGHPGYVHSGLRLVWI